MDECEFKNNLREIRHARGMSQLDVTKLTDIAPTDISRIENGWLRPYPGWRKRLARALGTTEAELFPVPPPVRSSAEGKLLGRLLHLHAGEETQQSED